MGYVCFFILAILFASFLILEEYCGDFYIYLDDKWEAEYLNLDYSNPPDLAHLFPLNLAHRFCVFYEDQQEIFCIDDIFLRYEGIDYFKSRVNRIFQFETCQLEYEDKDGDRVLATNIDAIRDAQLHSQRSGITNFYIKDSKKIYVPVRNRNISCGKMCKAIFSRLMCFLNDIYHKLSSLFWSLLWLLLYFVFGCLCYIVISPIIGTILLIMKFSFFVPPIVIISIYAYSSNTLAKSMEGIFKDDDIDIFGILCVTLLDGTPFEVEANFLTNR